ALTGVNPSSVTVNGTGYVFTGHGSILSTGFLKKTGSGTLTINTTGNIFIGGVTVAKGTLAVSKDATFGAMPTLALDAGASFRANNTAQTFHHIHLAPTANYRIGTGAKDTGTGALLEDGGSLLIHESAQVDGIVAGYATHAMPIMRDEYYRGTAVIENHGTTDGTGTWLAGSLVNHGTFTAATLDIGEIVNHGTLNVFADDGTDAAWFIASFAGDEAHAPVAGSIVADVLHNHGTLNADDIAVGHFVNHGTLNATTLSDGTGVVLRATGGIAFAGDSKLAFDLQGATQGGQVLLTLDTPEIHDGTDAVPLGTGTVELHNAAALAPGVYTLVDIGAVASGHTAVVPTGKVVVKDSGVNRLRFELQTESTQRLLQLVVSTPEIEIVDAPLALASKGTKLAAPAVPKGAKAVYQWYFTGADGIAVPILNAKKSTYTAKANGTGLYTVEVSYTPKGGTAPIADARSYAVELFAAPKIAAQNGFVISQLGATHTGLANGIVQGESLTFAVTLEHAATGGLDFVWLVNGKELAGNRHSYAEHVHADTFTLTNVGANGKAPKISVRVETRAKDAKGKPLAKVTSKAITPKLVLPPTAAEITTKKLTVATGKTLTLKAKAKGSAHLIYTWYKEGTAAPLQSGTNAKYAIKKATIGAVGSYYVVVTNGQTASGGYSATSAPVAVSVTP
ncbi:MAG: immunoglobulin domain-containing protein, partial [Puniceicoccales bacterium]|nr:immunoglobulin domain-containing protein [Puniceicoccales bacterium]